MQIHQFNIQYLPLEDRLLFRLNTTDHQVILLLFTRRMIINLVATLDTVLEAIPLSTVPERVMPATTQETKKALTQFEHDSVVQKSDFKTPFEDKATSTPLGEAPLLLHTIQLKQVGESQFLITFIGINKQSISLNLNEKILHSFYHLLSEATRTAEWGVNFGLKASSTPMPDALKEKLN